MLQIADVTAVAGRERLLRERQNARYDAVVGSAPDAILTLDADGVIQFANPAAGHEFGYPPADLIGQKMGPLLRNIEDWNRAFGGILEGVPVSRPIELTGRRKERDAHISPRRRLPAGPSEGRIFVTAILRDVNERRMAVEGIATAEPNP